jgi:hypothetical protein
MPDLALSEDAALVLALAGTAMPFADSPESEAEHWLRILRMHGEVGAAMQALGVGEKPLEEHERPLGAQRFRRGGENVVEIVTAHANGIAERRGVSMVGTVDVLEAVMSVYGKFFDGTLEARGATRDELLERLSRAPEERSAARRH